MICRLPRGPPALRFVDFGDGVVGMGFILGPKPETLNLSWVSGSGLGVSFIEFRVWGLGFGCGAVRSRMCISPPCSRRPKS